MSFIISLHSFFLFSLILQVEPPPLSHPLEHKLRPNYRLKQEQEEREAKKNEDRRKLKGFVALTTDECVHHIWNCCEAREIATVSTFHAQRKDRAPVRLSPDEDLAAGNGRPRLP